MLAGAAITAAFDGDDVSRPGVLVEWLEEAATAPTATPRQPPASEPTRVRATPSPEAPAAVEGFAYPIVDACLPLDDNLMPGAERAYRDGMHEGVDFYNADNCAFIEDGTAVMAAKAGTVVRADWDYEDLTFETLAELEARVAAGEGGSPDVYDAFRGRQVWIDHGDGTLTRYCHLSGVAEGIEEGVDVAQGELIAYVGESGTPESVTNPDTEFHLHFEIRVGESFLGQGLSAGETRELYEEALAP
jgi:murein DD-endopeptidase MepM/ murein hydrolase activator NlpD